MYRCTIIYGNCIYGSYGIISRSGDDEFQTIGRTYFSVARARKTSGRGAAHKYIIRFFIVASTTAGNSYRHGAVTLQKGMIDVYIAGPCSKTGIRATIAPFYGIPINSTYGATNVTKLKGVEGYIIAVSKGFNPIKWAKINQWISTIYAYIGDIFYGNLNNRSILTTARICYNLPYRVAGIARSTNGFIKFMYRISVGTACTIAKIPNKAKPVSRRAICKLKGQATAFQCFRIIIK